MEPLRLVRGAPASLALRAIAVGAYVPGAGWLHIVETVIPADEVLGLRVAGMIVVVFDDPLPQADATTFTDRARACGRIRSSDILRHRLRSVLSQRLREGLSD